MADIFKGAFTVRAEQAGNNGNDLDTIVHPEIGMLFDLQAHSFAIHRETATVSFTIDAGDLARATVPPTRTEQGFGKTFLRICGIIVIVEPNSGAASSGYVGVSLTGTLNGTTSAAFRMTGGLLLLLKTVGLAGDVSAQVDLSFAAATNKRATIYFIGEPTA